jgi:hypothetical protein
MRKILFAVLGVLCLTAPAPAQTPPAPKPKPPASGTPSTPSSSSTVCAALTLNRMAPIVAQYPTGGAGLANAVAEAIEKDPTMARDAAAITSKVTQDQKLAIAAGMAQAAAFFKKNNNATGLEAIQAALPCADGLTRSAFLAASSSLFADQNGQDGSNTGPNTGGAFAPSGGAGGVGGSVVD